MKIFNPKLTAKQLTYGSLVFAYSLIAFLSLGNVDTLFDLRVEGVTRTITNIFGLIWQFGTPIALLLAMIYSWKLETSLVRRILLFLTALVGVFLLISIIGDAAAF